MFTAIDLINICESCSEYTGHASGFADIKGINPGAKDVGRMKDILDKAGGNKEKALQLVRQMAKSITKIDKAQRRAAAALEVFPDEWAEDAAMAFMAKF